MVPSPLLCPDQNSYLHKLLGEANKGTRMSQGKQQVQGITSFFTLFMEKGNDIPRFIKKDDD